MNQRIVTYIFLTIAIFTLIVWIISEWVVPIFPDNVENRTILFFIALNAIIAILARLNNIIALFQRMIPNENNAYPIRIGLAFHPQTSFGTSFSVEIANRASTPLTIKDIQLALDNDDRISLQDLRHRQISLQRPSLPIKLEESDHRHYIFPISFIFELNESSFSNPLEVAAVEVLDSYGKVHTYPRTRKEREEFTELKSEVEKYWSTSEWVRRTGS